VAVNALWPRTVIATAAVQNLLGGDAVMARARSPEIVSDAAHVILTRPSRQHTGQFYLDEEVLASAGVTDLARYSAAPPNELLQDLFVP
jgi:citronellol/citronellal dehydrogenase